MRPGIINTYDQCVAAGGDRICLSYHKGEGRSPIPSRWVVVRYIDGREKKTRPDAPWYDHGHQTFNTGFRQGLQDALVWVKAEFGKTDFVRNRMGDYVEREVNTAHPIPRRPKL